MFPALLVWTLSLFSLIFSPTVSARDLTEGGAVSATLTFAVGSNRPPYSPYDGREGLEQTLVRTLASTMGLEITVTPLSNARSRLSLESGTIDGVAIYVGHKSEAVFLSEPLMTFRNVFLGAEAPELLDRNPLALLDKAVIAFQNARLALGPDYNRFVHAAADYREVLDQKVHLKMLLLGRADYLVGEVRVLEYYLSQTLDSDLPYELVAHQVFPETVYRSGFTDPALMAAYNAALRSIRDTGIYDRILGNYEVSTRFLSRLNVH